MKCLDFAKPIERARSVANVKRNLVYDFALLGMQYQKYDSFRRA